MNKGIVAGAIVVLGVFFAATSLFVVKEGEYKVVTQFGEFVRISKEPGLRLKYPFIETVVTLPKYQKVYDSKPTPILTKDKKPILVDNYAVWRF